MFGAEEITGEFYVSDLKSSDFGLILDVLLSYKEYTICMDCAI